MPRLFVQLIALTILTSACASTGAVPRPFPTPGGTQGSRGPAGSQDSQDSRGSAGLVDVPAVVATALSLRGAPYRSGGADPQGFDCSGFTQYVFSRQGLGLPRAARDQFQLGQAVKTRDIAPGDLLFFTTTEHGASHVGIAISSGEFVHAPSSTGVVRVERIDGAYWARRFLGARRL